MQFLADSTQTDTPARVGRERKCALRHETASIAGSDDQLLARFDDVAADFARRGRVRASHVYRSDALVAGDPPFLNAALAGGSARK